MGHMKIKPHPLIDKRYVHLFRYKVRDFIYFIHSTRSSELDPSTAKLFRSMMSSSANAVQVNNNDKLVNQLDDILAEEKAIRGEINRQHKCMKEIAANESAFRKWRREAATEYYIYLTRKCNLACRYCWNQGGTLGEETPAELNESRIEKIFDFIFIDSSRRNNIRIILFGGEPLLINRGLLKHFFEYGDKLCERHHKSIDYLMDTNGTVWDHELAALLKRYDVDLMVSIDGTERQHDKFRRFSNGRGSHELVMRNMSDMIKELRERVGARAVLVDPDSDMVEAYDFMRSLGCSEIQLRYHYASGFAGGAEAMGAKRMSSLKSYKRNIDSFVVDTIDRINKGKDFRLDSERREEMACSRIGRWRLARCRIGSTQVAIQTDGKIYPCPQMHSDEYCIGNVDDGIARWDLLMKYASNDIISAPYCRECWARFRCSGICAAESLVRHGDERRPVKVLCGRTIHEIKALAYLSSAADKIDPSINEQLIKGYI